MPTQVTRDAWFVEIASGLACVRHYVETYRILLAIRMLAELHPVQTRCVVVVQMSAANWTGGGIHIVRIFTCRSLLLNYRLGSLRNGTRLMNVMNRVIYCRDWLSELWSIAPTKIDCLVGAMQMTVFMKITGRTSTFIYNVFIQMSALVDDAI